jgi:hypothetical protein
MDYCSSSSVVKLVCLSAIVVRSAVAPVAFYSALDAFKILVAHERRHLAQAERVMSPIGFPKRHAT